MRYVIMTILMFIGILIPAQVGCIAPIKPIPPIGCGTLVLIDCKWHCVQ